ncbi:MAG: hypothetical protein BM564_10860 [Bacteroidetes bacterium MedPE-SWsnd-G2]|nr:MAG: hypothetical protein BM564_10860 [Bacteroidetes bacterium MedPE-SWsnd-G2]
MKKLHLVGIFLCLPLISFAQDKGLFSGGFESNSQYYVDDSKTGDFEFDDPFRSNSYLRLSYEYKNWFANIQGEAYVPQALLNYYPEYEDVNLGTFAAGYKSEKFEFTLGHFYEQFGSGLALRTWEDRQLGINNAIRGANVKYRPTQSLEFTALYGRQRDGFSVSDGDIYGFNAEVGLDDLFNFEETGLDFGFSYVGRDEDLDISNPDFESLTSVYSGRIDFSSGNFYAGLEYDHKTDDVYTELGNIIEDKYFDGNAFLLNAGYAKSGLGIDATFRRMENMAFYSQRDQSANIFNQNIINYVPALTKQHDYSLTNIYVYQSQPRLSFNPLGKAGEIGGQIDIFYKIKKGSSLGGKYGTKLAFNFANWYGLGGTFDVGNRVFESDGFFGFGEQYFREASLEIRKKFSKDWSGIFTYVNSFYNKRYVIDQSGEVDSNTFVAEATYKMGKGKSIRMEGQYLSTKDDMKDWAGGTFEFNLNRNFSFFATDIYNFGNDDEDKQIHYYNFGGRFTKGATSVGFGYGRQRGGLLCVGGICRFVPESTGFTLNLSTSF